MRIVYFARVREALGCDGEEVDFPTEVATIDEALNHLAATSKRHAAALADRSKLRFALDAKIVKVDALLGTAEELAIFPPVTGG